MPAMEERAAPRESLASLENLLDIRGARMRGAVRGTASATKAAGPHKRQPSPMSLVQQRQRLLRQAPAHGSLQPAAKEFVLHLRLPPREEAQLAVPTPLSSGQAARQQLTAEGEAQQPLPAAEAEQGAGGTSPQQPAPEAAHVEQEATAVNAELQAALLDARQQRRQLLREERPAPSGPSASFRLHWHCFAAVPAWRLPTPGLQPPAEPSEQAAAEQPAGSAAATPATALAEARTHSSTSSRGAGLTPVEGVPELRQWAAGSVKSGSHRSGSSLPASTRAARWPTPVEGVPERDGSFSALLPPARTPSSRGSRQWQASPQLLCGWDCAPPAPSPSASASAGALPSPAASSSSDGGSDGAPEWDLPSPAGSVRPPSPASSAMPPAATNAAPTPAASPAAPTPAAAAAVASPSMPAPSLEWTPAQPLVGGDTPAASHREQPEQQPETEEQQLQPEEQQPETEEQHLEAEEQPEPEEAAAADAPEPAAAEEPQREPRARSEQLNQRLKRMAQQRRSLAGEGMQLDGGVRRSTRTRHRPLDWWRQESKVYSRQHRSLPTVDHVVTHTPPTCWKTVALGERAHKRK